MRRRVLTIRAKILAAFLLIAIIIGSLGYYAINGMNEAGRMVVRTFDMPLMAINHARLAKSDFSELRLLLLRRHLAAQPSLPDGDRAIAKALDDVREDLDIAAKRSLSPAGIAAANELSHLIGAWSAQYPSDGTAPDWTKLDASAAEIERQFTVLINIAAGDAFRWRQQAISTIESNRLFHAVGVFIALLLAAAITFLLARQIVRPIEAAAHAAGRIAGGELETPIPKAGGDETGALLAAMTVMQDNLRAMMAREVAERRSAQRRLVDAIESSREGVVLVSADGGIVVANSEAGRLFPAAAEKLVPGQAFADFISRVGEHGGAVPAEAPGALAMANGELELNDGRWIRVSRSAVGDGGFVLIWSDITPIKEREARLRAAKDEAEAANTAKTQFLANMSHELRTPLNAIIGFSEMIAKEMLGPIGSPQYKGYAGDIFGSGQHLLAIINDILDIAKSQAGTLQIEPRRIEVATLFEECAKIIGHGCARAKLHFEMQAPATELSIYADPVKTRQILLNLLSNAMKFTPAGGSVRLWAEAADAEFLDLVVSDTGIGMKPEDIPVALAPFGQIDSRLARKYEGTGLGLPLTKILTELHGGELTITSKSQAGTLVRVRMPRRIFEPVPKTLPSKPALRAA